jgi:hypothetical protein
MEEARAKPVCAEEALNLLNCVAQSPYDQDKCVRLLQTLRECVLNKVCFSVMLFIIIILFYIWVLDVKNCVHHCQYSCWYWVNCQIDYPFIEKTRDFWWFYFVEKLLYKILIEMRQLWRCILQRWKNIVTLELFGALFLWDFELMMLFWNWGLNCEQYTWFWSFFALDLASLMSKLYAIVLCN